MNNRVAAWIKRGLRGEFERRSADFGRERKSEFDALRHAGTRFIGGSP